MSSYDDLRPKVEQAWLRGDSILDGLAMFEGEPNLAALGACFADVYKTLGWGAANHIISVFFEANAPLRRRQTPIPISDEIRRLATERPYRGSKT